MRRQSWFPPLGALKVGGWRVNPPVHMGDLTMPLLMSPSRSPSPHPLPFYHALRSFRRVCAWFDEMESITVVQNFRKRETITLGWPRARLSLFVLYIQPFRYRCYHRYIHRLHRLHSFHDLHRPHNLRKLKNPSEQSES